MRFSKRKVAAVIAGLTFLILSGVPASAGVTGKISGRVIDAETGVELPGASIRIDGTTMGNMAGPDGSYYVTNVPAGGYSVTASLIGYISMTVKEVRVKADGNTEVSFKLKASAVEVEGVTVVAERKVIDPGVTASMRTISTDDIQNMPVKEISEILSTQVGFVTKANELHVRGGRAGEALFIIDGVETRDLLGGLGKVSGGMNVSSSDIEEISVMKSGFDAEYGNVQSAVINVVTKGGSSKITTGKFEFETDDFGAEKLNKFSRNSDRVEFALSGPDPFLTTQFLPSIGIKFLGEKLAYHFSAITYKTDTWYQVNEYATPTTQKRFRVDRLLGFDVPERLSNDYSVALKLTYKASADKSLIFSNRQNWERYSLFFDPSGGNELKESRGAVHIWEYRYVPSNLPQVDHHNNSLSLRFTHNVSKSTFYEVQVSRFVTSYYQRPGDPDVAGGGRTPGSFTLWGNMEIFTSAQDANFNGVWDDAEPYLDVNQNGSYDEGEPFQDVNKGKNGVWDPGEPYVDSPFGEKGVYDVYDIFDPDLHDLPGEGRWNNAEDFYLDNDDPTDPNDGVDGPDGKFNDWKLPHNVNYQDLAEPFVDGDVNLGEPFTDLNKNGIWDSGEPFEDLSANGSYDGPLDPWTAGVPYEDRNHNGRFELFNTVYDPGEEYVDLNHNGKWDAKDGFWDWGNERRCYYHNRSTTSLTLKLDFTSQVTRQHQLKSGLMMERLKVSYGDIRYPYYEYPGEGIPPGPWPDRGYYRDFYTFRPVRGAFYIRDKIEYGAMIANLGFRSDFFIQAAGVRGLLPEETPTGEEVIDTRTKISPRIGVSYPISDKAKVYFNYGHFYQLPQLHYMYMQTTQAISLYSQFGNYNLDYMKQIQYDLGVEYAMASNYKLTLSGFYKDIFGQMNTEKQGFASFEGAFNYWANSDYGRTRGLELELRKSYGGYISGYVNYQYAYAFGKSSMEASNYYQQNPEKISIREYPLDWDVRHQITTNFDLRVPADEHPELFGYKLPDNWGVNLIWQFRSGYPFTPTGTLPGVELPPDQDDPTPNSRRMPSYSNVDLRFNKDFRVWKLDYSFMVLISNLLDKRNVGEVWAATGRPDTNQNERDQLAASFDQYVVRQGKDLDTDPLRYLPGRNIRVGLAVNF